MRNVFRKSNGNSGNNTPMTPLKAYFLADDFFHKIINKGAEKLETKTGMTKPLIIGTMTAGACLVEGPLAASVGRNADGIFMRICMLFSLNIFSTMKYFPEVWAFENLKPNPIEVIAKYFRFPMLLTTLYGAVKYLASSIDNIDALVIGTVSTITLYLLSTSHGILDKLLDEAKQRAAEKQVIPAKSEKG